MTDIRDNLIARIDEAQREGRLGEAKGLKVSLAGTRQKLAHLDEMGRRARTVPIGIPPSPKSPAAPDQTATGGNGYRHGKAQISSSARARRAAAAAAARRIART